MQSQPATDLEEFSLDALLEESMQTVNDAKRLKEARKAIKEGRNLPSTKSDELMSEIRRIESLREWRAVADVAMFELQTCKCCGNIVPAFQGFFMKQVSRTDKHLVRWLTSTKQANFGLPKEVKTHATDTDMCHFCMPDAGYPLEQLGIVWEDGDEEPEVTEDEPEEDVGALHEQIANLEDALDEAMTAPFEGQQA